MGWYILIVLVIGRLLHNTSTLRSLCSYNYIRVLVKLACSVQIEMKSVTSIIVISMQHLASFC